MNLFELIYFLTIFAGGYFCGDFLGSHYGIIGWVLGFLSGALITVLIWRLIKIIFSMLFPDPPICKNGKCVFNNNDYEFCGRESNGKRKWRCKCGIEYMGYKLYFKELLADGTLRPYMKNRMGRWTPDNKHEDRKEDGLVE